jgi:DNA excision repair protein ERCC-4
MSAIQAAIMECVEASVKELKKGNSGLDMEDWNLDNALHQNFDAVVMRQLHPVWHRLNWRTKQIAGDLRILRNMLEYLLTYDAVNFNQYLDTVLASSQPRPGSTHQNQSPWLFLDAADTIFETAKRRVYAGKLLEAAPQNNNQGADTIRPVLEELPKWAVLAEILEEIERDAYFNPVHDDSSGAILIMCGDHGTCAQLREYLQTMHAGSDKKNDEDMEEPQASASFMMKRKLRNYIKWKRDFAKISASLANEGQKPSDAQADPRGQATRGRAPPNKRRRVRGASLAASGPSRSDTSLVAGDRDAHFASLLAELQPNEMEALQKDEIGADSLKDMDKYYELYDMSGLVVIHPYDGDIDEHVLEEVKPRYVVMYEPDAAFIRRVEVYRSSHTDRNVRTYFMYYKDSVEEQRYLSLVRKEKDAFTRLIRERAVSFVLDTRAE